MNKVKTIRRHKLTKNISSYMMRCVILIRGLFQAKDDYEQNRIKLNQEISQLKEQQNAQAVRLFYLETQLSEEKSRREKSEAMNQDLKSIVNKKSKELKSIQDSNVQL